MPSHAHCTDPQVISDLLRESVDMSVLKSYEMIQLAGAPDLIVELVDLYLLDAPRRVVAMRESSARGDWPATKRDVHSLKGSSGTLGALQVVRICEEIEGIEFGLLRLKLPVLLNWLELELDRAIHIFVAVRQTRMI